MGTPWCFTLFEAELCFFNNIKATGGTSGTALNEDTVREQLRKCRSRHFRPVIDVLKARRGKRGETGCYSRHRRVTVGTGSTSDRMAAYPRPSPIRLPGSDTARPSRAPPLRMNPRRDDHECRCMMTRDELGQTAEVRVPLERPICRFNRRPTAPEMGSARPREHGRFASAIHDRSNSPHRPDESRRSLSISEISTTAEIQADQNSTPKFNPQRSIHNFGDIKSGNRRDHSRSLHRRAPVGGPRAIGTPIQ
jgi:hypothetical protein